MVSIYRRISCLGLYDTHVNRSFRLDFIKSLGLDVNIDGVNTAHLDLLLKSQFALLQSTTGSVLPNLLTLDECCEINPAKQVHSFRGSVEVDG